MLEWLARERTVGQAWPGRVVRIYDDDGRVVPPHTEGTVYMNLGLVPNFTYYNADELRAAIERDGLITSGDIGYLDEDGYLFLCDRRHDLIISGGANIWPAEIENVLSSHEQIADCAVFAVADEALGQVPAAAVQPKAGRQLDTSELARS